MPDVCELRVGGMIYGGWTDIEIQRGLEQVSGQFTLQVTDRWPEQTEPRPIMPGQSAVVTIDNEPVVTGWVDDTKPGYDEKNTWFNVTGRDKTCDLIDCSAMFKTGQWKKSSLLRIATDLLSSYSIAVVVGDRAKGPAGEIIDSFNIEEGETVFDCLERAARLKAVMLWTDGMGRLVIDLPGSTKATTALIEGQNIKRIDGNFSWHERYSEYIVKGQARGHAQHNAKGTSTDSVVTRHRPLIILAEDQVHGPSAQQRADWECTVRKGRGNRATIRVQSWRQGGDAGPLWVPGLRVPVTAPHIHLNAEMLIAHVTYIKNATDGTVTDLEIADPRAFDRLAGIRTASLKSNRTSDKGLANNRDKHAPKKHKKKAESTEDWSGQ